MKNKNNLVLTIIAIVTILVTVIGATFAYFGATVNTGSGSTLSTVVEENDVLFTATGSNMTMEITADKMSQHASKDGVIVAGDSSDSIMNVTLTTGTEGSIACNYNIYFQWDSTSTAYLTKTTGATKEFTAQLALTDPNGNGSAGTNKFANETQLTDVVTTVNKTLVVEGASIVANASQSGSQSWTPIIKFYNLQLNQTDLAGKTFKGKFTIDDVECGAHQSTLSETIIAKVNYSSMEGITQSDYISSQDSTSYRIAHEWVERLGGSVEDAGIRYEGKDPDNYITFNGDEEWRIIGVFEGSTIGLEPGKQYTKIIKSSSIGGYFWDSSHGNDWENASLNAYLNGTYLGAIQKGNQIAQYNGGYSTWYIKALPEEETATTSQWYLGERYTGYTGDKDGVQYGAKAEIKAAIGLMYPSDYGYAAYGNACINRNDTTLDNYNSACGMVDWLSSMSGEWLISPNPSCAGYAYLLESNYITTGGNINCAFCTTGNLEYQVRPTLYLEANLTATGTGTKLDPYVLN